MTTLIVGDSNLHGFDGKEVDTEGSVNVRSVGGLCVVAAVNALLGHKHHYDRINQVVWSLGTNDALHQEQHCLEERKRYLKLLYTESKRLFPQAEIKFVVPFVGMDKVPTSYIKELSRDITESCNIKVYRAPSMRQKLCRDGVHLNKGGRAVFMKFIRRKFAPHVPQLNSSSDCGPVNALDCHENVSLGPPPNVYYAPANLYATAVKGGRARERSHPIASSFRVNQVIDPAPQVPASSYTYTPQSHGYLGEQPAHSKTVTALAEALTDLLMMRRQDMHRTNNSRLY